MAERVGLTSMDKPRPNLVVTSQMSSDGTYTLSDTLAAMPSSTTRETGWILLTRSGVPVRSQISSNRCQSGRLGARQTLMHLGVNGILQAEVTI